MNTTATTLRPARRTPLQRRLVLLLLLIGILPALLVGLVGQQQAARALDRRARADLSNLAASVVDKLDRTLFERSGDVRLFADVIRNGPLFTGSVGSFMDTALAAYAPMYRLIVMADPAGRVSAVSSVDQFSRAINSPALLGRDVRGQPWYQAWATGPAAADAAFVQDLHADPLLAAVYGDAGRTVTFSYPVHDINGEPAGVLALFFNWDVADTLIAEVLEQPRRDAGASINLTLVNNQSQVLSTSDARRAVGATLDLNAFTSRRGAVRGSGAAQAEAGAFEAVSADWQGLMASYAVSRGYGTYRGLGWAAVASQAPYEALAALRTLQLQLGAFGALVALLVALIATRTGGGIARPILALTRGTQRAAAGDLSQHVTVTSNDEIGDLAASYNQMVGQLRAARDTLEQQVEQRTAALRAAVGELEASIGQREQLAALLQRASIPLVPLTRQVALLTLVGEPGAERMEQLLDVALGGIERERARVLLLDITAVPVVDTAVAGALLQIARGARLLGCELVLVGVRPEVAQSLVGLGVDLGDMTTHGVLQEGLAYALARTAATRPQRAAKRV